MRITGSGIVFDTRCAPANERSASSTAVLAASDGTILVTMRLGSDREGPDGHTAILASADRGATWTLRYLGLGDRDWAGERGETRGWYLAELEPGTITASVLFVDRLDGVAPWIHPRTQGLLPMSIWHLRSRDGGRTWTDRSRVACHPWRGASPTGPVLALADGSLAQPFETWKEYEDEAEGRPAALLRCSRDGGRTWPDDQLVARDPGNAIFYWDQRLATDPETGTIVSMCWTHEPAAGRDRDVHILWGTPDGRTWSAPQPTGLPGQHCQPIALGGGRLAAVYTHRGAPAGIRLAISDDLGRTWDRSRELEVWSSESGLDAGVGSARTPDEYWNDMGAWQFGHPRGCLLPDGELFLVWYGGTGDVRPARWARVALDDR